MKEICEIIENADLKSYNTYRIDSSCKYLAFPKAKEELVNLIKYIKENNMKYFLLGNGSNIILPDEKFDGVVISFKKFDDIKLDGDKIIAESGAMLPKIANLAIDNSLKGLEWATAIPGTLGGSIVGNAGAYLHEIMEFVQSIEVLDEYLNIKTLTRDDIVYSYRSTSLKEEKNKIILEATLKLQEGNKEESLALVKDRLERRKASQPLAYPSAGSVFRNPSKELPAGKIIEDLNFKGKKVGGAEVSEMHANFIINKDNATSKDIKKLINMIKEEVKDKYNIELKCEQEIVEW